MKGGREGIWNCRLKHSLFHQPKLRITVMLPITPLRLLKRKCPFQKAIIKEKFL